MLDFLVYVIYEKMSCFERLSVQFWGVFRNTFYKAIFPEKLYMCFLMVFKTNVRLCSFQVKVLTFIQNGICKI